MRDDVDEWCPPGPQPAQHNFGNVAQPVVGEQVIECFGVAEAAERLGRDDGRRVDLLNDLAQFMLAVKRRDRAVHRADMPHG